MRKSISTMFAAELFDQCGRGHGRAAGGQQIVHDDDITAFWTESTCISLVSLAVFERIAGDDRLCREGLALLRTGTNPMPSL